jgi:hypothetical protein
LEVFQQVIVNFEQVSPVTFVDRQEDGSISDEWLFVFQAEILVDYVFVGVDELLV